MKQLGLKDGSRGYDITYIDINNVKKYHRTFHQQITKENVKEACKDFINILSTYYYSKYNFIGGWIYGKLKKQI